MLSEAGVREKVTLGTFLITLVFILIEYFQGGVATHHLLARGDLPGISNWWGLVTVPLLSWIALTIAKKGEMKLNRTEGERRRDKNLQLQRILYGSLFGAIASTLWVIGLADVLRYYILLPFLLSLFFRVYLPAYVVGFVVGMTYAFGGVLPVIVGLVLVVGSFLINTIVRFVLGLVSGTR